MRKARDLIGLPVIEMQTGRRLGTAKDLLLSADWQAECLVMETKTWFTRPRTILWEDVASFGEDAVLIPEERVIFELPDADDKFYLCNGTSKIAGLSVLTEEGEQLGIVSDVYFSEIMDKRIIGFELTEGFLSDVTEGRKWLPFPEHATKGDDVIIVPGSCSQEVRPSTNRGIG